MSFDWRSLVGTVAPTIATALGGPLAGMAVKAVGDALGLDKPTEEAISATLQGATPDTLLKLKQADQDFAVKMRDLDIKLDELETKDKDSARNMLIQTRSYTPSVLSWIVVMATLALEGYVMLHGIPKEVDDLVAGRVLGTLDTAFGMVLTFWLGTSFSSRSKDDTIKAMAK